MTPYYQDSLVTIYHGDCLQVLPRIHARSVAALVSDPPFAFAGGISNGQTSVANVQFFLHWWRDVCEQIERVAIPEGEGFLWCDWRTAHVFAEGFRMDQEATWRLAQMIYHHREMPGQGTPFRSSVDMIAYMRGPKSEGRRVTNTTLNWISQYWYYGKHEHHPAEKSVTIAEQLVRWSSDPGNTVLDPFMGSGSSVIAARNLGRRAIGIEIEERYCEIAAERCRQEVLDLGGAA